MRLTLPWDTEEVKDLEESSRDETMEMSYPAGTITKMTKMRLTLPWDTEEVKDLESSRHGSIQNAENKNGDTTMSEPSPSNGPQADVCFQTKRRLKWRKVLTHLWSKQNAVNKNGDTTMSYLSPITSFRT